MITRKKYTFTISVNFDSPNGYTRQTTEAAIESADEFAMDLKSWLEKHPFVEGCHVDKELINDSVPVPWV